MYRDSSFIIGNGVVSDGLDVFIENGAVLIEDGLIKNISTTENLKKDGCLFHDVRGKLILPGFLNAHSHFYSYLTTGFPSTGKTSTFREILENYWWPIDRSLDRDSVYYSTLAAGIECLRKGVTMIFDHHSSMNYVSGSLDTIADACNIIGIKALLCFEISDRMGKEEAKNHIDENLCFCKNHLNSENIKGCIGLHANFTLSEETLLILKDKKPKNIPIHIHCGEDLYDLNFCIEKGYKGPVDRLNSFQLLSDKSILAHCVHLSEHDIQLINKIKPVIVSNPESNANNRVGKMNRKKLKRYVLGTDAMSYDMISSLRSHFLLESGITAKELINILFKRRYTTQRKYFNNVKGFEIGGKADIAVLNYTPLSPVNKDNLIYHLLYGAKNADAYMTVIDGKILFIDGKCTSVDEEKIYKLTKFNSFNLYKRYKDV